MAKYSIDDLTIGEIGIIESLGGASIDQFSQPETPKANMMAAMAYVIHRRENPEYTFNEALSLPLREIEDLISFDEDEDTSPKLPAPQDHLPKTPPTPPVPALPEPAV